MLDYIGLPVITPRNCQYTAAPCWGLNTSSTESSSPHSTGAYSPGAPLSALPGLLGTQSNACGCTAACGSVASARVMGWSLSHSAHPDIWRNMSHHPNRSPLLQQLRSRCRMKFLMRYSCQSHGTSSIPSGVGPQSVSLVLSQNPFKTGVRRQGGSRQSCCREGCL